MPVVDRNQILREDYSTILKKKLFSQIELTDNLTEEEILSIFDEIKGYFGAQVSENRIRKHFVKLIERFSEEK